LAACFAWSSAAYGKTYALKGEFVEESPGVLVPTGVNPDPNDPFADVTFAGGTASVTGTWMGQNLTSGTARINLVTAETTGTYDETFTGTSDHGGFGQVMSHGTASLGPADATGAQQFRADASIIGGTRDFAGSRGRITYTGVQTGGVGTGTYTGTWILPNAGGQPSPHKPKHHRKHRWHRKHRHRDHHHDQGEDGPSRGSAR
jgi:hypothetical protein